MTFAGRDQSPLHGPGLEGKRSKTGNWMRDSSSFDTAKMTIAAVHFSCADMDVGLSYRPL